MPRLRHAGIDDLAEVVRRNLEKAGDANKRATAGPPPSNVGTRQPSGVARPGSAQQRANKRRDAAARARINAKKKRAANAQQSRKERKGPK